MSSAVAPSNVEELQGWLQDMIKQLAFTRLITAVVALVARLRDLNTELTKQLAQLRRARPRSERLRAIEAQLALPWAMNSEPRSDGAVPMPESPTTGSDRGDAPRTPKGRKGKHPGRQSFPKDLERVPQYNGVPPRLRLCPQCGIEMGRLGHTQCEYLDVIPARVVVVQRTDETLKCKLDDTIVSAPPPPRIVERGLLGNRLIMEATADKFLEHQPIEPTVPASLTGTRLAAGRRRPYAVVLTSLRCYGAGCLMDPNPISRKLSDGFPARSRAIARAEGARFWPGSRLMS